MLNLPITISQTEIEAFCERHHIRKLALFGSVLRDDFRPDSDIDVLVEYVVGEHVTFFDMVQQENELSGILNRTVDMRTPPELSRHFRKKVMETAQVIYERT
jgi:predicted nucleotidyltransferase